MQLHLDRQVTPLLKAGQGFLLRRLIGSYEPYHPVFLGSDRLSAGERACIDRWSAVEPILQKLKPTSFLDLGCAEGYFVQQAATSLQCMALGIDADERRLTVARITTCLNAIQGAGFLRAKLDPDYVRRLPQFDAVVFLSVMHHIMYEHGIQYAREFAAAIRKITRQCLIFDMGQSNEKQHAWSGLLPDMGSDPRAWVQEFLVSAGFNNVEIVAETDAYKSEVRRHLFVASP